MMGDQYRNSIKNNETQKGLRYLEGPLNRRFRTRQKQLENKYLNTKVYSDTMFHSVKSAHGNNCAQIFVTSEGFATGKPMASKGDAYEALEDFCRNVGIPKLLVTDQAKEEMLGDWE
jgi:hypothetical protein